MLNQLQLRVGLDLLCQPVLEAPDFWFQPLGVAAYELPAVAVRHREFERIGKPAGGDIIIGKRADGHRYAPALDRGFLCKDIAVEGDPVGRSDIVHARRVEPAVPVFLRGIDMKDGVLLEVLRPA